MESSKILKILVIEDNDSRAQFIANKLKPHEVNVLKDPVSSVEALRSVKYDLVFLDYDLTTSPASRLIEKGTGIYIAKRLSETINKFTPVVVHSMNIKAAKYMVGLMENAVVFPFAQLRFELDAGDTNKLFRKIAVL